MEPFLLIAVAVLGTASYVVGVVQMLSNAYVPSTFSRVVWVLLAANSFAGVIVSQSSKASVVLAGILLLGNLAMCVVSLWKGTRSIGILEYVCLGLLAISLAVWILFHAPLVNLSISLFAHFVGAAPTYKKVWSDPKSESPPFWSLFFLASLLSVFASQSSAVQYILLPIYFTLFDGSLFVLSLRRYWN